MKIVSVGRPQIYLLKEQIRSKPAISTGRKFIDFIRGASSATRKVLKSGLWFVELVVLSQVIIFPGWDINLLETRDKRRG